jgi:hypothetical protein
MPIQREGDDPGPRRRVPVWVWLALVPVVLVALGGWLALTPEPVGVGAVTIIGPNSRGRVDYVVGDLVPIVYYFWTPWGRPRSRVFRQGRRLGPFWLLSSETR